MATVVESFMRQATVNIRRAGSSGTHWDEALGRTVATPYAPFAVAVPADVQPLTAGGAASDAVDQQVWVLGYRVAVPRNTAPTTAQLDEGILIDVISCPSDPLLDGTTMKVNDVIRGTHRFQRILIADANS
jgi:hypothetical protein